MSIIINEIYNDEFDEELTQDSSEMLNSETNDVSDQEDDTIENTIVPNEDDVETQSKSEENDTLPQSAPKRTPIITKSLSRSGNEEENYRVVGQLVLESLGDTIDINIPIKIPGTPTPTPSLNFNISYSMGNTSGSNVKLYTTYSIDYSDNGAVYNTYQFGYDVRFNGYGVDYNNNLVSANVDFKKMIIPANTTVNETHTFTGVVGFAPTGYEVMAHTSNPTYTFSNITLNKPFLSLIFHDFNTGTGYHGFKPVSGKCKLYISNPIGNINVNKIIVSITVFIFGSLNTYTIKNTSIVNYTNNDKDYGVCDSCPFGIDKMFSSFSIIEGASLDIRRITVNVNDSNIQAYAIYAKNL